MPSSIPESIDTDVLVVGGGGSGLVASVSAVQAGARVTIIEKYSRLGGTTALAVGSVTAGGSRIQRRAGYTDSPDAFREDLAEFAGSLERRCNPEMCRLLCDKAGETVDWLEGLGVVFYGPSAEPPHRVPRMHNVVPGPRSLIRVLEGIARREGVQIMLDAQAKSLILERGRIVGLTAVNLKSGKEFVVRTRRAVILATGDYSSSEQLKARFAGERVAHIEGVNHSSTGDGHLMAMQVGAGTVNMDILFGPELRFVVDLQKLQFGISNRFVAKTLLRLARAIPSLLDAYITRLNTTYTAPSPRLFGEGAIAVNRDGRRFANELIEGDQLAIEVGKQGEAHIVFDDRVGRKFGKWPYFISTFPGFSYAYLKDYKRFRRDVYSEARTLEELGDRMGVNAEFLTKTIDEYNNHVSMGVDTEFRRRSLGEGISVPPYYALGPVRPFVITTEGALTTNAKLEVLDERSNVIPGLYAVGSVGSGGLVLLSHGTHLGWAFVSGRIAGSNSAAELRESKMST